MALRFVDGVGYYDTTSLRVSKRYNSISESSGLTVETTGGPFGDSWIKAGGSSSINKTLAGTTDIFIIALRYKPIVYETTGHVICTFFVGAQSQLTLYDDRGTLKVYRGEYGGTLLGTSATPLLANAWQYLEMKFKIHDSTGYVTVRQGTVETIALTDQDTQLDPSKAYADNVQLHGGTVSGHSAGIAHIVIMDTTGTRCNDFLGDRRVQILMPTSDGNYKEFACSTGSDHFELVNEIPPNETDYNESDAAGERDTFGTGSVANSGATIDAVITTAYCKTDDGGAASIKALVRSAGDDGEGTEVSVPSSYGFVDSVVYVDPDTTNPFTATALNAAEKGYKRQT